MLTRATTCALLLLGTALPSMAQTTAAADADLPKIVLIGDSIRLGYAPLVTELLKGKAIIISPKPNGGDSANVLRNLDEWVIAVKPDIVHLNCGLHDLKLDKKTKKHQVEPAEYEKNLQEIVDRIRKGTNATLIFATTTPIVDDRHAQRRAPFDRFEADVRRYNEIAGKVMKGAGVPINDLHAVVEQGGPEKLLGRDGTHYTAEGNRQLADAVVGYLLKQLNKK